MGETKKEKKVVDDSRRGRNKPRARSRLDLFRKTYEIQGLVSIPESLSGKRERETLSGFHCYLVVVAADDD